MTPEPDDQFLRRARQSLDHSVESLDPGTRARLAAARRHAIGAPPRQRMFAGMHPAALAFALVAALALGLWLGPERQLAQAPAQLAGDETELLDLLALDAPAELLDDPDFYVWVEDQLTPADGAHAG